MALITSISGIRGTIGGQPGNNLTPIEIVKFTAAFAHFIKQEISHSPTIIVARDARVSGPIIMDLVQATLNSMGVNVKNIDLATTPTTEIAVINERADGGIIITASHNPFQWNALKFLNAKGEFLEPDSVKKVIQIYNNIETVSFAQANMLGMSKIITGYEQVHINQILQLPLVKPELIKKANFTVALDCINSVGSIALPPLLKALGVQNIIPINCEPNGLFAHSPEPLEQNVSDLIKAVKVHNADVGFVVDPDVDRLAIIDENGSYIGEEYTLVAVADYILQHTPGNTVSNLSSSRALRDITEKYGYEYFSAPVGEINVIMKMKQVNAVIGGEGNGGVIYPELHYGRDALVGIALFLSYMAWENLKPSQIKSKLPQYYMFKTKITAQDIDFETIKQQIIKTYANQAQINTDDGIKLDFPDFWIHIRKSNTEPIIRIYTEAKSQDQAQQLAQQFIQQFFNN